MTLYLTFIAVSLLSRKNDLSDHKRLEMSIHKQEIFTEKQGQYLAFIYYYTKINRIPPAHADFESWFKTSPSSVHQMILQLERKHLIRRTPNTPRAIVIAISEEQLPKLK